MIRSSNLLNTYSTYLHPVRNRVVYDSSKPFEMVFENSEEFEELMLSLYLLDKYLSTETGLTFETDYPELWQEKKQDIELLFEFLTQRKISLAFVARSSSRRKIQRRLTKNFENRDGVVSLFSGGLDSAAGAIELIKKGSNLALSHTATGNITFGKATELLKYPSLNSTTMIVTNMRGGENLLPGMPGRNTRGLLFISNALVIASCLGFSRVCVPENGPLMINPDISHGSGATKNAHPFLITTLEEIYNHVTKTKIRIEALFKDLTKAEISAKLGNNRIIDQTWSCFNVQGQSRMCGACFACAVRRLSLLAAGYNEPKETYETNPFYTKLQHSNSPLGWKLDDLHDTFVYLRNLLKSQKFSRNELFLIPEGFFENETELMSNFALDMFLGFRKQEEQLGALNLGPLGRFVKKIVDEFSQSKLCDRENDLKKLSPSLDVIF
jgi:7-cyano-7-deazaguanine synthase in queuosine biosynthesis